MSNERPRNSLSEAFPDLVISTASSSHKRTIKMQNLSASIGKALSTGWPLWRSINSTFGGGLQQVQFTIRLARHLKLEAERLQNIALDPATIINEVRNESQKGAIMDAWGDLEDAFITLVYGSNLIESAGTTLEITIKLCRDIFRGKDVDPSMEERDPAYQEHLEHLIRTHRKGDRPGVIRSRKEVIFHAKALNFLIDRIVLDNTPWSEDLILETHRILYEGVDEDVQAGKYRDHEVAVSYSKPGEEKKKVSRCIRAKVVPAYMKDMVEHLNSDITAAEASGELDPYTLAARYHHQFVMIHPFSDGNGRLSRIILNVLLLKYAGHLSTFGSEGLDKDDYLNIVRKAAKTFHEEDMEREFDDMTMHFEFSRFLVVKSKEGLEKMKAWVTRRKGGKVIEKFDKSLDDDESTFKDI